MKKLMRSLNLMQRDTEEYREIIETWSLYTGPEASHYHPAYASFHHSHRGRRLPLQAQAHDKHLKMEFVAS